MSRVSAGAPVSLKKRKNLIKEAIWSSPMPESGMDVVGPGWWMDVTATLIRQ